jgi:hypothetical protein
MVKAFHVRGRPAHRSVECERGREDHRRGERGTADGPSHRIRQDYVVITVRSSFHYHSNVP